MSRSGWFVSLFFTTTFVFYSSCLTFGSTLILRPFSFLSCELSGLFVKGSDGAPPTFIAISSYPKDFGFSGVVRAPSAESGGGYGARLTVFVLKLDVSGKSWERMSVISCDKMRCMTEIDIYCGWSSTHSSSGSYVNCWIEVSIYFWSDNCIACSVSNNH